MSLLLPQETSIRLGTRLNFDNFISSAGLLVPVLGSQNFIEPSQLPLASFSAISKFINQKLQQYMNTVLLILLWFIFCQINCLNSTLEVEILDSGQTSFIELQKYFQFPKLVSINQSKSTPGFKDILNVSFQKVPVKTSFRIQMEVQEANRTVKLSDHHHYATKSIYNQPIKIYLLDNNYLMMLIYMEHCRDQYEQNRVIGFDIGEKLQDYKDKNLNCTSFESVITYNSSFLLVSCRYTEAKAYSFIVVSLKLITDSAGFINGLQIYGKPENLERKIKTCSAYSLKRMQRITIIKSQKDQYIYAYCSQTNSSSDSIYYFNGPNREGTIISSKVKSCINGASYIDANENGFSTIIGNKLFEYYNDNLGKGEDCVPSSIYFENYNFATSRTYGGVGKSYIFLKNNSIIIKSSYRTNYQIIDLQLPDGYESTSFSLNQHFMGVCLSDKQFAFILIYNMESLNPVRVDVLQFDNQTDQLNYVLMSANNYLEKGFYYFEFNKNSNQLSLKQYKGYSLQFNSIQKVEGMKQDINLMVFLQDHDNNQSLEVEITVRGINNKNISFKETEEYKVSSLYADIDLFQISSGPLQKYYSTTYTDKDKNIFLEYINYYDQIDIAKYMSVLHSSSRRRSAEIQQLRAIALNNQLKGSEPPLMLYYDSFIQMCVLQYKQERHGPGITCNQDEKISFHSNMSGKNHLIVLERDKWLQYNKTYLQLCQIPPEGGTCSSIPLSLVPVTENITKIKLVDFESRSNGYIDIQVFILCDNFLYFGHFRKESSLKSEKFIYISIFTISEAEIEQLSFMDLRDIHYDPKFQNYILLHIASQGDFRDNVALLFDHPQKTEEARFIGHLIKKFDDGTIKNFLTAENYLIIISLTEDGQGLLTEMKISQYYQAVKTRNYPLFGNRIVFDGSHYSDGTFIYIQVQSDSDLIKHLVYCPNLNSANLLTHILTSKEGRISFVQDIGSTESKYYHSIGFIDSKIFSLSTPNLVIQFQNQQKISGTKRENCTDGNISIAAVDFINVIHEVFISYRFDNSDEIITYQSEKEQDIDITQNSRAIHRLNSKKINGPVIFYDFIYLSESCPLVEVNPLFHDVFTQKQCLLEISVDIYGQILDFISIVKGDYLLEVIVTTNNLLCVENKRTVTINQITQSKNCAITSQKEQKMFIVCEEGQQSTIKFYDIKDRCHLSRLISIDRPQWLTYKYFTLKYSAPYTIFQIPIGYDFNKIYFLTQFNETQVKFDDAPLSIKYSGRDNFLAIDFAMDKHYLYLLENGLGVYPLDKEVLSSLREDDIEELDYIIWINVSQFREKLNTTQDFVYINPLTTQIQTSQKMIKYLQIGTIRSAFKIRLELIQQDPKSSSYKHQLTVIAIYRQLQNCKNSISSKSKVWQGKLIKVCTLQEEQKNVFSNFIPLADVSTTKYLQFYSIPQPPLNQTSTIPEYFPFRMSTMNLNPGDIFQINNASELIVTSFFNFLCYYDLATDIMWTLTKKKQLNNILDEGKTSCEFQVKLWNNHYETSYTFSVFYDNYIQNSSWKAWIPRSFFFILVIIFAYKVWLEKKQKEQLKRKINKFSTNIYSNDFEIRVRMNTKKSIGSFIGDQEQHPRSEITFR